jgi:tripartite-type tricarboxylate transporter receptor subunit TctC
MNPASRIAAALACAFTAALGATAALAQSYPAKPIRMIAPIPPGSIVDVTGRAIGQSLAPVLGQPIVVENRVGANGTLGMEACARSPGDGYTICIPDGNIMTLNPFAYTRLPYDPLEFVNIIHIGDLEQSIVVQASMPVKNMKDLIDLARANPGKVTWGSGGAGSTMHLYMEWLHTKTGVRFNHIPYKGPQDLVRAMAAGEVQATNLSTSSVAPLVKEGRLRMIAVVTGKQRSQYAGDTPTFAEQGFELDFRNWLLLNAPKGTPAEVARRWNTEVNKLLADPGFQQKVMASQAMTPGGGSPADLDALLKRKLKVGEELAKMANLKYD